MSPRVARSTNSATILRTILVDWMAVEGWSRWSQLREWIDGAETHQLRFALAWSGTELAGIACYVVGRPHSPVVIVAEPWRRRGVGTQLLSRLKLYADRERHTLAPWTKGPGGDALCRRLGLSFKRVRG